ncbi:hypothetical protein ACFQ3N_06000 [Virgibacillus byunsanensis]|uniref:RNA polymerase subunit sigma n=1 Tax=Virgibacillus byunsanensis TaxID=570945 RepID=A0ABW3LKZ9_9BACI
MILLSWKSIEMQVALPRTQDAGKLQDQMLKQNQHFQASLAQSQMKQEEQKRKRVNEFEDIDHVTIKKEEDHSNNANVDHHSETSNNTLENTEHPYLGKHFDFSG